MKIKRFFALLLLFALILSLSAFADVAYFPMDDFIMEHADEYVQENRYYISNSPEGYVTAYSSPTGTAKAVIPNGLEYYIYLTWQGGETTWGCIEYVPETTEDGGYGDDTAWLDMSLMTPRYDSKAFMAEHEAELREESRSLEVKYMGKAHVYLYPGSGIVTGDIYNPDQEKLPLGFSIIYTDSEGRDWGYIGYHYGLRNIWICLDEPYIKLPAGAEYREPEIYPAASPELMDEALSELTGQQSTVIVLAAGVIIIAAAIVAYIIIRKRKRA